MRPSARSRRPASTPRLPCDQVLRPSRSGPSPSQTRPARRPRRSRYRRQLLSSRWRWRRRRWWRTHRPAVRCTSRRRADPAQESRPLKTIIEPFRIKVVEPIRLTTRGGTPRAAAQGRLEPVRDPRGRRDHRPAHRLGHQRDERRAVGRRDARRRVVRRLAVVLSLRVGGARADAVPAHHSRRTRAARPRRSCSRSSAGRAGSFRPTRTSTRRAATSRRPAPRPWTS